MRRYRLQFSEMLVPKGKRLLKVNSRYIAIHKRHVITESDCEAAATKVEYAFERDPFAYPDKPLLWRATLRDAMDDLRRHKVERSSRRFAGVV